MFQGFNSQRIAARKAFTLVELLVAMSLMGILAGMIGMALSSAQSDARRARASLQIAKIREILMNQWDDYTVMQVQVRSTVVTTPRKVQTAKERARSRLVLLRDRMHLEMPDRITDLQPGNDTLAFGDSVTTNWKANFLNRSTRVTTPQFIEPASVPLLKLYQNRIVQTYIALGRLNAGDTFADVFPGGVDAAGTTTGDDLWTREHQSSECLYLILSSMSFAGRPALSSLRQSEINDTDGDGMPEIVDPWGTPLAWARWPAGYWTSSRAARTDLGGDGFDPLNASFRYQDSTLPNPFNLEPIIVSAGSDGEFEMRLLNGIHADESLGTDPDSFHGKEIDYAISPFLSSGSGGRAEIDPFYVPTDLSDNANDRSAGGVGGVGHLGDLNGDGYDGSIDNIISAEI